MIEFYPEIRSVHIGAVIASGALFCLRGILMLAGSRAANHVALRWPSYASGADEIEASASSSLSSPTQTATPPIANNVPNPAPIAIARVDRLVPGALAGGQR